MNGRDIRDIGIMKRDYRIQRLSREQDLMTTIFERSSEERRLETSNTVTTASLDPAATSEP
jgi:hypothetical protein